MTILLLERFHSLDYVNGGELFTHLNKRQHFTEQDAKIYIAELALALGQLHKVNSSLKNNLLNVKNLFSFSLALFIVILNWRIFY